MHNNFTFSKLLADFCLKTPFLWFISSASVYGDAKHFIESKNEKALNYYAYSKLLFDEYIRDKINNSFKSQIVGLRYFNVFGPHEEHKNRMASVIFHFYNQMIKDNRINIFEGSHGLNNGEHKRDFIHVDNVVDMNLWFLKIINIVEYLTVAPLKQILIIRLLILLLIILKNKNDFNLTNANYINYIKFPADLKEGINHIPNLTMKI